MPNGNGGAKAPAIKGTEADSYIFAGDSICTLIPAAK
jgi:hypothetical protein